MFFNYYISLTYILFFLNKRWCLRENHIRKNRRYNPNSSIADKNKKANNSSTITSIINGGANNLSISIADIDADTKIDDISINTSIINVNGGVDNLSRNTGIINTDKKANNPNINIGIANR